MRILLCAVLFPLWLLAADGIKLPPASTEGGKPLMQTLKLRASTREYKPDALPPQSVSNLLWAAFGVNRPDGKRTAPSTHGKNCIDIYVVDAAGAWRYDAAWHQLEPVAEGDHRALTTTQDFAKTAALNLVYVANTKAFEAPTNEELLQWTAADAGLIGQNVYLFCASEGLGTVIRAGFDRAGLTKVLKLRPDQRIVLAQTVGVPK
jgi:nitroreductase